MSTKHFVQKGNYMCLKWKKGSILSYHTEPAALHVWSIDRTLQVNNPTLVWAQPRGAHCTGSWWQLLWGTQQTNTIHMNICNSVKLRLFIQDHFSDVKYSIQKHQGAWILLWCLSSCTFSYIVYKAEHRNKIRMWSCNNIIGHRRLQCTRLVCV